MASKRYTILFGSVAALLTVVSVGISAYYIALIAQHLWNVDITLGNYISSLDNIEWSGQIVHAQCILTSQYTTPTSCGYAFALGSATIASTIVVVIVSLVCSKSTMVMSNMLYSVINFIWWMIGSSVLTTRVISANNDQLPETFWRTLTLILGWAQALVCLVLFFDWAFLMKAMSNDYDKDIVRNTFAEATAIDGQEIPLPVSTVPNSHVVDMQQ
jgi:hypothetical protein